MLGVRACTCAKTETALAIRAVQSLGRVTRTMMRSARLLFAWKCSPLIPFHPLKFEASHGIELQNYSKEFVRARFFFFPLVLPFLSFSLFTPFRTTNHPARGAALQASLRKKRLKHSSRGALQKSTVLQACHRGEQDSAKE